MRAGHRQNMSPGEHVLGEPLRPGDIALPAVQDRLHERVTARDDVADDPEIRLEADLLFAEALGELDP